MDVPLFIKIEDYRNVTKIIDSIKTKADEAKQIVMEVNDLKRKEDLELETCIHNIDEIDRKIEHIKALLGDEAR